MPIYEYECSNCGRIEVLQGASEKALTQCPTCKEKGRKSKVSKLVSGAAFHLKGSGWYKTDYASSGSSGSSKKGSKSGSASDSGSSSSDSGSGTSGSGTEKAAKGGGCGGSCACH